MSKVIGTYLFTQILKAQHLCCLLCIWHNLNNMKAPGHIVFDKTHAFLLSCVTKFQIYILLIFQLSRFLKIAYLISPCNFFYSENLVFSSVCLHIYVRASCIRCCHIIFFPQSKSKIIFDTRIPYKRKQHPSFKCNELWFRNVDEDFNLLLWTVKELQSSFTFFF